MQKLKILLPLLIIIFDVSAQHKPFVTLPTQLADPNFAEWIVPQENEGVFYFRKAFFLNSIPDSFIVHVSADARYKLYVNGSEASWGPAVGDLENWNYETVNIAPFLKQGDNILAAQVWNRGRQNGAKQISNRTAFILQGNSVIEQVANTNNSWNVYRDPGYFSLEMTSKQVGGGYIAGATDSVVVSRQPMGWKDLDFDDSTWEQAQELGKGNHSGLDTWKGTAWKLQSRLIPVMEQKKERIPDIIEIKGINSTQGVGDIKTLTIPPHSHVEILLDNKVLTMGYPQLYLSGGNGGKVKIQYQEALFNSHGTKGNRNEWQGKIMKGYYDVYLPDGGSRLFEPLWLRVFRFVKISVDTKDDPLKIEDFYNKYTAYPLKQKAYFQSGNDTLDGIWDASWRTAQLCALESYMDCPYYEQLQYIGDTRIQALISMNVAGDDRLARNAIEQLYGSMQSMGLTKSAHPTSGVQIIPPFSLVLIGMIHDYYMMRDDPAFVKQYIPGMKFILEWFIGRIGGNGMLGPLPYWNHIDGGTDFINGSPPGISEGGSAHMSILLAYALDYAVHMLRDFGYTCDADRYQKISAQIKEDTYALCYSPEKQLIAETPAKEKYSQHTNIFAILTNTYQPETQKKVANLILKDKSLIQTTLYFKFYLFQALKKAGMGEEIISLMDEWQKFLDYGLTTFPEHGVNSRSDCHAWSAHPMYDFLNITLGVAPASPGFKTVEIRPALGDLTKVQGSIPHPKGLIECRYEKLHDHTLINVILPDGLKGVLFYEGAAHEIQNGANRIEIKN